MRNSLTNRRSQVSAAGKVEQFSSKKGLPGHRARIEGKVTTVLPYFSHLSKITEMSKNLCISFVSSIYFPCLTRRSMEQFLENSPKLLYFWRTKPHPSKRVLLHRKHTHVSSSSFPLLQISFLCPDCGTVCYVIVSSEQLHFLSVSKRAEYQMSLILRPAKSALIFFLAATLLLRSKPPLLD